jgi:hypothetical protein
VCKILTWTVYRDFGVNVTRVFLEIHLLEHRPGRKF